MNTSYTRAFTGIAIGLLVGLTGVSCGSSKDDPIDDHDGGGDSGGGEDTDTSANEAQCEAMHEALDGLISNDLPTYLSVEVPGVVLGVESAACGRWVGAWGNAIIDPETPMTSQNLFMIMSVTKTFTAAVILQLVEEGSVALDDTMDIWLPTFPRADEVTVGHLLQHTSGIYDIGESDEWFAAALDPSSPFTTEELLALAADEDYYFDPGDDTHYSSTNYIILGEIARQIDGEELEGVYRVRLLDPLGLDSTFYAVTEEIVGDLAHGYLGGNDITELVNYSAMGPAGAMISSADDQITWIRSLFDGTVLQDETVELMIDSIPVSSTVELGLGLEVLVLDGGEGEAIWGHGGTGPHEVYTYYVPSVDAAVTFMINTGPLPGQVTGSGDALRATVGILRAEMP